MLPRVRLVLGEHPPASLDQRTGLVISGAAQRFDAEVDRLVAGLAGETRVPLRVPHGGVLLRLVDREGQTALALDERSGVAIRAVRDAGRQPVIAGGGRRVVGWSDRLLLGVPCDPVRIRIEKVDARIAVLVL